MIPEIVKQYMYAWDDTGPKGVLSTLLSNLAAVRFKMFDIFLK